MAEKYMDSLGKELEDYVARRFMEATGKKVRRANFTYYDEKYPFMLADVDRMIVGENTGLECKTASPYLADQWKDSYFLSDTVLSLYVCLQCGRIVYRRMDRMDG